MTDFTKANLAAQFGTDKDKEEQGVWIPLADKIRVKIRRFKSKASQDARTEFQKPYIAMIRRDSLSEEVSVEILEKQMAKAIIVDWEGITDDAGNDIPCTYENKLAILKALPDFRDEIAALAIARDSFKAEDDADAEKNLPTT